MKKAALLALLLLPGIALAAQDLEISKQAMVEGDTVPIRATLSATTSDIVLSDTNIDGAVPVTITFYVAPKPKPQPATSSQAAAVQSSQGIQNSIAGVSPQTAQTVAPFFTLVDGGRQKTADVLQTQLDTTKQALATGAGNPGKVLSAESTKTAVSDPMGVFWTILRTLYLYVLTILLFLVSNAGVFYPVLALIVLYMLWRLFMRFRRA